MTFLPPPSLSRHGRLPPLAHAIIAVFVLATCPVLAATQAPAWFVSLVGLLGLINALLALRPKAVRS